MKTFAAVWVVCFLAGLAFWGTIGYVAYHFISKLW